MPARSSPWWSQRPSPAAKDAAEPVAFDYEPLPAVAHSLTTVAPGAPRVRLDAASNTSLDAEVGDKAAADTAFARAAFIAPLETWIPRVAGVPMEPRAAIGAYDRDIGRYTLYGGIGGAVRPKQELARVLGVAENKVRVVMHDVGGNFGTRGAFNPEFALVTWAARRVGRPVKWTCERQEAFLCDYQARDLAVEAELALDANGTVLAMRGSNLVNSGAYPIAFGLLAKGVEIMSSIYQVPAVHFRAQAAMTNTLPTRPYRSSGRPEVMFVMERPDRSRRPTIRLLSDRAAALQSGARGGDALPQSVRHDLRSRRLPPGADAGARRLDRVPSPAGGRQDPRQIPRHRRCQLRRHGNRGTTRVRRSDGTAGRWWRSSSARSRTGRATRPALHSS
jgi:hypothetical protein